MTRTGTAEVEMQKQTGWSCGIPALDSVLDSIWAGDNIVLEVDSIADFTLFAERYTRYTAEAGRKLVYFRFADHPPLVPDDVSAERHELDPQAGFEQFITEILGVIERNGRDGVYYMFDCLSGLAVDWYSDRMLGNFFALTCPYLYDYDAVAAFVLLRDVHTPLATRVIHDTAQVVLDVYRSDRDLYILPVKVFERSSPTMYMLHKWDDDRVEPVTQSVVLSEILSQTQHPWIDVNVDWRDPWATTFAEAEGILDRIRQGWEPDERIGLMSERLIRMMLSRDPADDLHVLCRKYFDLEDLVAVGKRMIGTGLVGGKSVGMLLARRILAEDRPDLSKLLEIHDSFYIGSDVYYSYLILNDCWWDRHRIKTADDPYSHAARAQQKLLSGEFPQAIEEQFREILDYFGQSPVIVRSSSLLEDAYGNSFSGKYESVFCGNQGSPERRIENFKDAVRTVYASTLSEEALSYRLHRGLIHRDEQMALLVQRVSGEFHGQLYYPHIGGVGYSFNPYIWNRQLDPCQGMLRLVFGLGTRAVDRHDDDYTRVVSLDQPTLRPEGSAEIRRFSQKIVNVIDLEDNRHVSRQFEEVAKASPSLPLEILASRDVEMESRARDYRMGDVFSYLLTFDKLLRETAVPGDLREMMQAISAAYRHPVDIEFTVNFLNNRDYRINLLQCRPFHFVGELTHIPFPDDVPERDIVLRTEGPLVGHSIATELERIIYVEPEKYAAASLAQKFEIARLIGRVTNQPGEVRTTMLMGPGRWGTRMPELGIPVTFTEIKNVSVLCEIARMHEGLYPDLSLGTHFFNDLVDMDVLYIGLSPGRDGSVLNEDLLRSLPNELPHILPDSASYADTVHVIDSASSVEHWILLRADAIEQKAVVFFADRCELWREHR